MSNLKISPEKAILLINGRIEEIKTLIGKKDTLGYYDLVGWCSKTWSAIDEIYMADDIHPEEIRSIGLPTCSCNSANMAQMLLEVYHSRLLDYFDDIQKSHEDAGIKKTEP
jgi:hypothetical protein